MKDTEKGFELLQHWSRYDINMSNADFGEWVSRMAYLHGEYNE